MEFLGAQAELHLLTDMHGNIGDHLIWAGTTDLLDSAGINYEPMSLHEVKDAHYPRSSLLIPGSGAFEQFWHEWLPDVVLQASNNFRKVIVLPSSFDSSVPVVARCLSQHNVFGFAREARSYRSIKAFGRAALSFDCAVYYQKFTDGKCSDPRPMDDGALLLALREDKGSLLPLQGLAPNPSSNQDISLTKTNLDEWIDSIAQAESIVTDRLHVAVAGVLLGKRLTYLDPYRQKISTYFNYSFRDTFGERVKQCSLDWLLANEFVIRSEVA